MNNTQDLCPEKQSQNGTKLYTIKNVQWTFNGALQTEAEHATENLRLTEMGEIDFST